MSKPTPIQSFTLDRSIFNESLYAHLRSFWFADLAPDAAAANEAAEKRWYGLRLTQEQKEEQDEECRRLFGHALQAVGPEKVVLPEFVSGEQDVREASVIARPFLEEGAEGKKGSETLLSLVILLDQITRNIFRDPEGLKLVFTHYDRLAHALVHSSLSLNPSPLLHPSHRLRPVVRQFFLMPLEHSEHLPSHHLFSKLMHEARQESQEAGLHDAVGHCDRTLKFEQMHMEPLEKFGRYPHRNRALGRESTEEEERWLERGETFGVGQGDGGEGEKGREKSEL